MKKTLLLISFGLVAGAFLTSCTRYNDFVCYGSEDYIGPLSESNNITVFESYFAAEKTIFMGYIDVDSDGTFDFFISVDDDRKNLDMIFDVAHPVKKYEESYHIQKRPDGVNSSPFMEKVYEAYQQSPDLSILNKLYAESDSDSNSWCRSLILRKKSDISERIIEEAFKNLKDGNLPQESAFILNGHGKKGVKLLGRALRETNDQKAARDAAIFLSHTETDILPALPYLVDSLDRDWRNTKHCVLSAILNIAKKHPKEVRKYIKEIRQCNVTDDSVKNYLAHIELALKSK